MNGGREGIVHEDSQVLNNVCDPAIHADNPLCITLAEKREDSFEDPAYSRPQHPSPEGANTTDQTSAVPLARTSGMFFPILSTFNKDNIWAKIPLKTFTIFRKVTSQHRGFSITEY